MASYIAFYNNGLYCYVYIHYIKKINTNDISNKALIKIKVNDTNVLTNIKQDIDFDKEYPEITVYTEYDYKIIFKNAKFSLDEDFIIGGDEFWDHDLIITYKSMETKDYN